MSPDSGSQFSGSGSWFRTKNCIAHAKDLFDFATQYPAVYSDSIPEAADFYKSWNGYQDELAWASIWLFRATQRLEYLEKARGSEHGFANK